MKDWKLLTDEELAALTEKEVEFYKKLLYAENGIKLVEKPNEPEQLKEPFDLRVYYIKGIANYYSDNIVFAKLEEAQEVADLLKRCKSLGRTESASNTGYENRYFEVGLKENVYDRESPYTVLTKDVYSKEKYLEMQSQLVAYKNMRQQYEKDKKEYEENNTKAIEVTKDFFDKLTEARNKVERRNHLTSKFYNDYLPLAENDYQIAMSFMKKAYNISEDDEAYIKNNAPKTDE